LLGYILRDISMWPRNVMWSHKSDVMPGHRACTWGAW